MKEWTRFVLVLLLMACSSASWAQLPKTIVLSSVGDHIAYAVGYDQGSKMPVFPDLRQCLGSGSVAHFLNGLNTGFTSFIGTTSITAIGKKLLMMESISAMRRCNDTDMYLMGEIIGWTQNASENLRGDQNISALLADNGARPIALTIGFADALYGNSPVVTSRQIQAQIQKNRNNSAWANIFLILGAIGEGISRATPPPSMNLNSVEWPTTSQCYVVANHMTCSHY